MKFYYYKHWYFGLLVGKLWGNFAFLGRTGRHMYRDGFCINANKNNKSGTEEFGRAIYDNTLARWTNMPLCRNTLRNEIGVICMVGSYIYNSQAFGSLQIRKIWGSFRILVLVVLCINVSIASFKCVLWAL